MRRILTRLAHGAFGLGIAVALTFGGAQALSGSVLTQCTEPSPGTCPPLDDDTCFQECVNMGYRDGGTCFPESGCCTCFE